jgi:voltage-gated potassium channel
MSAKEEFPRVDAVDGELRGGAPRQEAGYQIFMLGLSLFVIGALALQVFADLSEESIRILDYSDFAICIVFAFDFLRSLRLAENRMTYMLRWGWLDLLSSIPTVDLLRWGRTARVFRIIRVLRLARAARHLSLYAYTFRTRDALWGAILLTVVLAVSGSVAILYLESAGGGNITDAEDALWWTLVTISTVGYGDHYPITPTGRLLALGLMTMGIALFGVFTAVVAAKFIESDAESEQSELRELRREIVALREEMRETRETFNSAKFGTADG